ncbi:hypothetical protein [Kytococcus sedentarius]|uniref:hypothetical protein n=1 Tax=Kytococcus sedentarius TaxID=1276 RepID=UPI00194E72D0|nr:hypothetical protein [Kytococcus sedentarius]QRO87742.1 hypothetical protein I6J30_01820 [Kytococcus sedentarius]
MSTPARTLRRVDRRRLAAPLAGLGAGMCGYLLLRPYGDAGGGATPEAAAAFASSLWVAAHCLGVVALASFVYLVLCIHDLGPSRATRIARGSGLLGLVLVVPYYGAETLGLHAVGRAAQAGTPGVMALEEAIRSQPVAVSAFGAGLVLLALAAVCLGHGWQQATGNRAAWPLAALMAVFLPQFYLPPVGRMAYGVAVALAAVWMLVSAWRTESSRG